MSTITPQVLLKAYAAGVFPMAENAEDNTLYWVGPEFRGVLPLDGFHVPRSLRKTVRQKRFAIRTDTAFSEVIAGCAERTPARSSTWINRRIKALYTQLHKMGFCHSMEAWEKDRLCGGLYGVRIGAAFFGESMFSRETDASKVALVHLVARLNRGGFRLLDAQFINDHLKRFGAVEVTRRKYQQMLETALTAEADFQVFADDGDPETVLRWARGGQR